MAKLVLLTPAIVSAMKAEFLEYNPQASSELLNTHVAVQVLRAFLGKDWVDLNVFSLFHSGSDDQYFRFLDAEETGLPKYQSKVVILAEMLLNLQTTAGFGDRLSNIGSGTDLESAVGELEGAKLLRKRGISFVFVNPTGVIGQDYDVEIRLSSFVIPCEMKTKSENTAFTAETLSNTLEHARKQLPKGQESCVFIRIPEQWLQSSDLKLTVEQCLSDLLRRSKRLGVVCFHWEQWLQRPKGGFQRNWFFRPYVKAAPLSAGTTALYHAISRTLSKPLWTFLP